MSSKGIRIMTRMMEKRVRSKAMTTKVLNTHLFLALVVDQEDEGRDLD
jgi:hypothetical protein